MIDDGIRGGDAGALTVTLVLFVAAAVVNWVATYAQTYREPGSVSGAPDLRSTLFEHIQRLSVGCASATRSAS